MFPELNDILDINVRKLPSKKMIFVRELTCDASFVLYHMLCTFLKNKGKVVFLSLSQSLSHFTNVGNKLSINLKKEREEGNVVFIEGLKRLGNGVCGDRTESGLLDFKETACVISLKKIFSEVSQAIDAFPDGENVLLLTDDLSILSYLGVPSSEVKMFIQYLKQVVYCNKKEFCFVTLIHHDKYETDEELEDICTFTGHLAHMVVRVEDLASGFSHDVHGEMTVIWKDVTGRICREKKMQHRICDKTVNFFPLGMSSAVL